MSEEPELARTELERVVGFYADRYDTVARVHGTSTSSPKERHGVDAPLAPGFGGGWVASRDATPEMYVAADYSALRGCSGARVLQFHLLPRRWPSVRPTGWSTRLERKWERPEFIGAGNSSHGLTRQASCATRPLTRNSRRRDQRRPEPHYYDMAASGVSWLVAHSGNSGPWACARGDGRLRARSPTFGMTVDDFVECSRRRDLDVPQIGRPEGPIAGITSAPTRAPPVL